MAAQPRKARWCRQPDGNVVAECSGTGENQCGSETAVGKAEGQGCPNEGQGRPEEGHWPQADEPCYEEETVGDDESKVGSEEEGGVGKNRVVSQLEIAGTSRTERDVA